MKTLYLLGGPMGVGKSAAGQELKRLLPRSVFLDGDWCWDADPFQVTDETRAMVLGNIRYLLGSFLGCTAYENVIFCWVMHEQGIIDGVLSGLDLSGCEVRAFSLLCGEAALRERLEGDIARGLRAPDVLPRSLARLPLYAALATEKLDTTGMSAREVALALNGPTARAAASRRAAEKRRAARARTARPAP